MDNAYDFELRKKMLAVAHKINIPLATGIYLAVSGPSFETHSEIRMFKMFGADAVGMSTVPETILARHTGMKVVTVCTVTNFGAGLSREIISHEGTLKGAAMGVERLTKLFVAFVEEIGK
jgi:purine nucleoside phosphorylase